MKALLITHDFLPDLPGGISTYYYHLCKELDGAVSVLTPAGADARAFDAAQPFAVYRRRIPISAPAAADRSGLLGWPRAGALAVAQSALFFHHGRRLIAAEGVDTTLIGHLYLAPTGRMLRAVTGAGYGVLLHGSELHRYFRWAPVRRVMLGALDAADFLVVNSEFTRRQYMERGVRSDQRVVKVNPGVDTRRFHPEAGDPGLVRRRHGLADRPVVASVARLVAWKGQDTMIRALPAILDRVPDAVYMIVGDGPYRRPLERLIATVGLEDRVVFTGFVPESDLPAYYRAADVVAVPTREAAEGMPIEGFGIVFLEANACGTPVVGGAAGGTDESIEHGVTGFRVDPYDADAVADAVARLLENGELSERMGQAGRRRTEKTFDWSIQAQRLQAVLDERAEAG